MWRSLPARIGLAVALILVIALRTAILKAQQKEAELPSLTLRAETRLVTVDVVVTDKQGEPISDLKADDFVVEENGKRQQVSVFVPPAGMSRSAPVATPPGILSNHPENMGPGSVPIVLLLDAVNSPFKEQAYGRSQMLKYVVEQTKFGHPMAVVTLTDRMSVLQQFTTDPQILLTAIKRFRPEQPMQPADPPPPTAAPDVISGPRTERPAPVLAAEAAIAGFADAQVSYDLERRTLITLDAMRWLARMLGGLPGRKSVVWLTAELPLDLIPENRTMSDAELLATLPVSQSKSVQIRAAGAIAGEERELHGQEIRNAEAQLATTNIAIYPVDLHGLLGGMTITYSGAHDSDVHGAGLANRAIREGRSLQASHGTMEDVAAETGGKAYINQNDIWHGVALAAGDDKASYEIAYHPDNKKWDGKYRSIKVKVLRADAQVRYRKGYYAIDLTQAKKGNYEQDLAAALQFNAPATQIAFKAQAKPTDPGKMRVLFLVDGHTLSAEESASGNKKLNVKLYASLFSAAGKNLATRSITVDQAFDAGTYQQIMQKGMMVPIDLDLPQGADQLRLAVLDNKTGFIGTVSESLSNLNISNSGSTKKEQQ